MANSMVEKHMDVKEAQLPVADRLWLWFDTYKRQVALGLGLLVVAGLVIWFIVWQQEQKQIEAGSALSQVAAGQLEGTIPPNQVADAYLKVEKKYAKSPTGARALLLAAGNLFAQDKYADAQTQFERFLREYQSSPLRGQALLGVASCLDAQHKTDQAVTAYKDLTTRHSTETFVPQAKFALARLYEAQNKAELARDLYQDVERTAPFTSIGNEAGVRMEELIAKNPKLAPAPAAPTPTATSITNLAPLLEKK